MDEKILAALEGISKSTEGLVSTVTGIDKRLSVLEQEKSVYVGAASPDVVKALEARINEMDARNKSIVIATPEMAQKNFEKEKAGYFKTLFKAMINKDFGKLEEMQKATTYTFNETVGGGSGQLGYFIPEEWSSTIINLNVDYQNKNSILPLVNMLPMNRHVLNLNEYVSGITAGMIGAGVAITDSTSSGLQNVLTAEKIACLVKYNNETLMDITPETLRVIENSAANAFAERMNYALLAGTGAEDYNNIGITGVLSSSTANVVTMASSAYNTIDAEDLSNMIDAITVDINNGVFVLPKTLRAIIRPLKDGAGNYIWSPAQGNNADTIWGYPVIWVNGIMPATSAITADTKFGIFGDFSKGAYWGDRMSLEVAVDTSVAFESYQTAVRWVRRGDGVILGKCFAVIKTAA